MAQQNPKRVIAPPSAPETAPDDSTQQEIVRGNKEKARSALPSPSSLLNDHREKTELRLIEEIDEARETNEVLVLEIRELDRSYASLRERHRATVSQRSSSAIGTSVGALLLAMASFDEAHKVILVCIGATASVAGIGLDLRACIESWMRPIQEPKSPNSDTTID